MEKLKKYVPQLCYVAAAVNFIASIVAVISRNSSGTSLGLGALFLALGIIYSKKSEYNKENKDNE